MAKNLPIISIIKDSFQEFSGEHSLVLFSYDCNFSCPECYNLKQVTDDRNIIGDGIDIIKKNLTPLHTAVVFLGGEPTIHQKGLVECVQFCKERGLKVKVFSNGQNPDFFREIGYAIDAVSFDVKYVENSSAVIGYNLGFDIYIKNIKRCVDCMENSPTELRTTIWDSNKDQIEKIKEYCKKNFPGIPHILQEKFTVK